MALEKRYDILSAELQADENEWNSLSREMPELKHVRNELGALLKYPKRVAEERAAPRWTRALRAIVTSREGTLAVQGLHARQMAGPPGACELRVVGMSSGPQARITADRFRLQIEQELRRGQNSASVKTGFLRLADMPDSPSAPTNQQRVTFEIGATVGVENAAVFRDAVGY